MNEPARYWQLQEAKNRLSQVVRDAAAGGPQYITVHGKNAAVVLSTHNYERLKRQTTKLSSALATPILEEQEAADLFERTSDSGRQVEF